MDQKYDRDDQIPDEAIVEAFRETKAVQFSARPFNEVKYRRIGLDGLGWWLPLRRVLPLIGITPQMLRPVFNRYRVFNPRRRPFPANLAEEVGLLRPRYEEDKKGELPEVINNYDQLGGFCLIERPFLELAKILGKAVEVWREDGGTGNHYFLFTTHPDGQVTKERVKAS